nr:putative ribonuclease H-like domain-containing protein [Tanacetum cinerariifolium]
GNSQNVIDDKGYWDNGCSRHMTGNISYLSNYEPYDGGFTWTFFLKTKDETSGILRNFITEIENLKELKVKIIRCDNRGEFRNKEMNDFCSGKGIKREFSNARTPQQNGVTERRNRTLIEAARTMLADAKLPVTFWAKAVNTACYVQNRVLALETASGLSLTASRLQLGRKAHLLEGKQILSVGEFDKVSFYTLFRGMKQHRRDPSSNGIWNLETMLGCSRLKEDLESSTLRRHQDHKATPSPRYLYIYKIKKEEGDALLEAKSLKSWHTAILDQLRDITVPRLLEERLRGDKDFKVGDKVLLFYSRLRMHLGKLKSKWYGPNVVKTMYPYGTVEITDKNGISFKVNGQRLKKYYDGHIDMEDKDVVKFNEDTMIPEIGVHDFPIFCTGPRWKTIDNVGEWSHDTQYCMEDPKQAFVEYASSRTDEAGGRGFLATANAFIDCRMAKIAAGEGINRESYKPQPRSDGVSAETPYYARKDFSNCHLSGEWEIARDAELNPFKDFLVFRRMVDFLGAITINVKSNMWESEELIKNLFNLDKPPINGDGAWHAKIKQIDPEREELTKTLNQSSPLGSSPKGTVQGKSSTCTTFTTPRASLRV